MSQLSENDLTWLCNEKLGLAVDFLLAKTWLPALAVKTAMATTFTRGPVAIFWQPLQEKAAVVSEDHDDWLQGFALTSATFGANRMCPDNAAADLPDGFWVKIAASNTLSRLGEVLHWTPSRTPLTGLEGRPLAAQIATGLLGAGLGYGAGAVGEQLIPARFRAAVKLKRRLALLGGLGGAAFGSVPGLLNLHDGRSFNDNTLLKTPGPDFDSALQSDQQLTSAYKEAVAFTTKRASISTLGGQIERYQPVVNVNELGETLLRTQAPPPLTAMTMGAVYGASQFSDPNAANNEVTPHQMGLFGLAMNAAGGGLKGYLTGVLVGRGLGLLTGMPAADQNRIRNTGAFVGAVGAMVPKLFAGSR